MTDQQDLRTRLPELPEPLIYSLSGALIGYTADQMRAYALEAAAQLGGADDVQHERDLLAEAIANAAIKCGLLRPDIEGLTGPQLLMMCDDMATALTATPQPDSADPSIHPDATESGSLSKSTLKRHGVLRGESDAPGGDVEKKDSIDAIVSDIEEHAKILAANGRDPSALDDFADRLSTLSSGAISRAAREAMGACPCGASMCDGMHYEGPALIELLAEMDRFVCEWEECTVEDIEHFANKLRTALSAPKQVGVVPESEWMRIPRPTDDDLWDQTLRERDEYHEMADALAKQIAAITGVDIGEHSSTNYPWQEAILAADDFIAKASTPQAAPVHVEGDGNFVRRWSKAIRELPMGRETPPPSQAAVELEQFRPQLVAWIECNTEAAKRSPREADWSNGVAAGVRMALALIDGAKGGES